MRSVPRFSPLKSLFTKPDFGQQLLFWLFFVLLLGVLAGSASALFLTSLEAVTATRNSQRWLIYLLPLGGWVIAWAYNRYGRQANQGNDLLIATYHQPKDKIPFRMAPMVLMGTLLTHLLGGSAGREGTAVQMGGAIADTLRHWFKTHHMEQRVVLLCGIAAGFASVFGTPWGGAVFAVEVMRHKAWPRYAVWPVIAAAWSAHWCCLAWGVPHGLYSVGDLPAPTLINLGYISIASIAFGAAAWLFLRLGRWQNHKFKQWIPQASWRAFAGGMVLAGFYLFTQNDRYLGLGLPVIASAFEGAVLPYDFLLKILFTTFTLAVGFKGGEVTPLFFIGASLGAVLAGILPLPVGLLAGMGFVAVFAGATNCPIACVLMGMELFGVAATPFLIVSCGIAYLLSGKAGIYHAQPSHSLLLK